MLKDESVLVPAMSIHGSALWYVSSIPCRTAEEYRDNKITRHLIAEAFVDCEREGYGVPSKLNVDDGAECSICGELYFTHNDDGSCVVD